MHCTLLRVRHHGQLSSQANAELQQALEEVEKAVRERLTLRKVEERGLCTQHYTMYACPAISRLVDVNA